MKNFRLWIGFVGAMIVTHFFGSIITYFLVMFFIRIGLIRPMEFVTWIPTLGLIMASFVIAISLSLLISRHFFKPIHQLVTGLNEVASGNFKIQLPEESGFRDMQEMLSNFNKMVRELNSIELLQSDFIQNVSHEFKTPLAAVEGYASLLNAANLPEEQHEYAVRILESTRQLSSLTGNILKLSKLENQTIITEKTTFSLDEQLRQAILTLEPLWGKKDLNFDLQLPAVSYTGSEDLLFQVWINLLSNAIKFTPQEGTISVRLKYLSTALQVEVQDTGIGMSEEVIKHIFDKFYQGEKSHANAGNGLGLALVKKILMLCGGSIQVKSEVGVGTTFSVRL